jgi:ABC-type phosphate/phosphonate transport system substrate-binding protein
VRNLRVKLLAISIFAATSFNVVAQEANFISKRQELVKKNQNNKPLVFSLYSLNNKNLDANLMWNKFAPYSNYLSEQLDSLVVMDIDNTYYNLNKDILDNADIIYSTPLLYGQLKEAGWRPVVRANQQITSVIIVPFNSNIKDLNGLRNKKIMTEAGTTMSSYLLVELLDKKIFLNKEEAKNNYLQTHTSTEALLNYLNNDIVQAIAISDYEAKKLLAESKNKYKGIPADSVVPGAVVYVSPRLNEEQTNKIQQLFLNMKLNDELVRFVLSSAGELIPGQVNQFINVNEDDLLKSTLIFRQSRISDLKLK